MKMNHIEGGIRCFKRERETRSVPSQTLTSLNKSLKSEIVRE